MRRGIVRIDLAAAVLALALAGALAPPPASAQSKTGTTIGQFLMIEPSARTAAMGNAGVAMAEGVSSAYYNPASIGLLAGPEVMFTHSLWIADIAYSYASGALPIGGLGNFFASVTALNSGEIEVRTVDQPLGTGERYTVSDVAVGLGYGRQFTDRFALGVVLSYVQESIWNSTMRTAVLGVGTVYKLNDSGLQIGASLSNFGTNASFDGRDLSILYDNDPERFGDNSALPGRRSTDDFPVPVIFRLGFASPFRLTGEQTLRVALDAFHPSDNTESISAGAEWGFRDLLALRAGWQNLFLEDSEVGLTFGAGLSAPIAEQVFAFDYAWADQGRLEETHRFTLVVSF